MRYTQATAQALLFKLRVLDLLEIILTKTGAASLLESLPKFLQLLGLLGRLSFFHQLNILVVKVLFHE